MIHHGPGPTQPLIPGYAGNYFTIDGTEHIVKSAPGREARSKESSERFARLVPNLSKAAGRYDTISRCQSPVNILRLYGRGLKEAF